MPWVAPVAAVATVGATVYGIKETKKAQKRAIAEQKGYSEKYISKMTPLETRSRSKLTPELLEEEVV